MLNLLFLATFKITGIAIMVAILFVFYDTNNSKMTYDFPIERYNRIKNSIINNLKNIELPEKLVKDLLDQFVFIDEIIQKSMYFKDFRSYVADILLSGNRENNYYINLQQSIENNLNNLLFIKAQQLKVN